MATMLAKHVGRRPGWECGACGVPWPCGPARADLLAEHSGHPSVLTVYLSGQMDEALRDLTAGGKPPPLDLYQRFLAWA